MSAGERRIEYDRNATLGEGGFAFVFRGTLRENEGKTPIPVAVKRIQISGNSPHVGDRELKALMSLEHPNVVKLFFVEDQGDFRCYAMELCQASLEKVYLEDFNPKKYKGPLPSPIQVIQQLSIGLEYVHNQKLIHRDIKPQNVLISSANSSSSVTVKWADFGLSKPVDTQGFHTVSLVVGTAHWMASELLRSLHHSSTDKVRGTVKSDVFSFGCLFFCHLTSGQHPFEGPSKDIHSNIIVGNPINLKNLPSAYYTYKSLLVEMLHLDAGDRPAMASVTKRITEMSQGRQSQEVDGAGQNQASTLYECLDEMFNPKSGRVDIDFKFFLNSSSHKKLIEAIRRFIDKGSDPKSFSSNESTALHVVCRHYHRDELYAVIKLLTDKGTSVDAKDSHRLTALHYLCAYHAHNMVNIVRLFIEKGADLNIKGPEDWTALHFLCRAYSNDDLIDIVRLFLTNGADVNGRTTKRSTALLLVCRHYSRDNLIHLIQCFLTRGADVNWENADGMNALHLLCLHYRKKDLINIVQLLIGHGIKINARNRKGETALEILKKNHPDGEEKKRIIQRFWILPYTKPDHFIWRSLAE